jgi:hypothetical protein
MSAEQAKPPLLLLSPHWRNRLQRVAAACFISPNDFAREAIEAEIVKREILLERQGGVDPQWYTLFTTSLANNRLQ